MNDDLKKEMLKKYAEERLAEQKEENHFCNTQRN